MALNPREHKKEPSLGRNDVLKDYKIAVLSRQASLIGRKEVLGGRAKFGIFGDGKEVAQVAMAKVFAPGDWRSGYYRDQTFMLALNLVTVKQLFAQLYADPDLKREPCSGGRQMNSHFATPMLDENGKWLSQLAQYNSSSDISPTGGQMARLLGLAYASKLYRQSSPLQTWVGRNLFSKNGSEVAFGTIGNASTSEGLFWETVNAAGVLQVPMLLSIWDDGYGISVPTAYQTTKGSIYSVLAGFAWEEKNSGIHLFSVKGYSYPDLVQAYRQASEICRSQHIPCIVHVDELTQPQGHSTSGSHERYKSTDRLAYEKDIDCLTKMREWMLAEGFASESLLASIDEEALSEVREAQKAAWQEFSAPILVQKEKLFDLLSSLQDKSDFVAKKASELKALKQPLRKDIVAMGREVLLALRYLAKEEIGELKEYVTMLGKENEHLYSSSLFAPEREPLRGKPAQVSQSSEWVDGRQLIQRFFDAKLAEDPRIFIIGEDVGKLGGVNLEFENLSDKHGELRVSDTGIREATILGQGLGAAMRGLRPIVDIQYLDYLLYCLQGMSDDLVTLRYRTAGRQAAPVIVRTKGHRLEGIWHTGSPMAVLLGALRGMHVCVPRNCLQACGMYQTILAGDDPALVVEVLNGYRVKEQEPANLASYSVELGVSEVLAVGEDLTVVTYGACVRLALAAQVSLKELGISIEVIDIQTLLPFDKYNIILKSLMKTHAVLFLDEDVPGGASAFMMQKVLEEQNGFYYLDATPKTLTAKAHRAAYGSDGDYFSKPNKEDVVEACYQIMHERNPIDFPAF